MSNRKLPSPIEDVFRFCPRCGNDNQVAGNNPFNCNSCDFTFFFSPVAAVGGIITNDQNQVLFLVRGKDPGKGKLGLPGGFADAGETLEESLRREVLEETSLELQQTNFLCSFPNQYTYRGVTVEVLDSFYHCQVKSFEPLAAQPEEVESFRIEEPTPGLLDELAFVSNRRAIEFFQRQHLAG
jgi:ADP-ribose pyrophosphatase